jgi:hypothetical protein
MALVLAHHRPADARKLLVGIEAVMLELPDLPDTWQVFGDQNVTAILDAAGLVRQERPYEPGK